MSDANRESVTAFPTPGVASVTFATPDRTVMTMTTSASTARKCLFGPSNPGEVEKLLDEEIRSSKRRLYVRFGVDMDAVERMIAEKKHCKEMKRLVEKTAGLVNKRKSDLGPPRGVLKQYNKQLKVTDIFKQKKNSTSSKDKEQ